MVRHFEESIENDSASFRTYRPHFFYYFVEYSFEDTLEIQYLMISSLVYSGKMSEALEKGIGIVSRIGVGIPRDQSQAALDLLLTETLLLLNGFSEDDLLNYRMMDDRKNIMCMKFLARLELIAFFVNPRLHHFLVSVV